MKHNPLNRAALLAAVVGLACLGLSVGGALAPMAILPKLDLPLMLGLSLIALTLDGYLGAGSKLSWPALLANAALGGIAFGLLPWCAGAAGGNPCLGAGSGGRGRVRNGLPALYCRAGAHRHRAQSPPGPRRRRSDAVPGGTVPERAVVKRLRQYGTGSLTPWSGPGIPPRRAHRCKDFSARLCPDIKLP